MKIQILKADIEGWEWYLLREYFGDASIGFIPQLLLELHTPDNTPWPLLNLPHADAAVELFAMAWEAGYDVVQWEHTAPSCAEFTFMSME